ncbi:hypothetical protein T4A_7634 [Trichinella pseudospiralis]|uniref:Uncharacterized protein n=1 Tax=Trichinella pseudospiralis TaxID=6337 RepID=A0A0V1KE49_TRIPS|nr:hypothetical protein T4A_7634 [Trichinella pseudospiralis]KRZ45543.1 hypothetical protein T4C_12754 [Trichinella pseudospiralis]
MLLYAFLEKHLLNLLSVFAKLQMILPLCVILTLNLCFSAAFCVMQSNLKFCSANNITHSEIYYLTRQIE